MIVSIQGISWLLERKSAWKLMTFNELSVKNHGYLLPDQRFSGSNWLLENLPCFFFEFFFHSFGADKLRRSKTWSWPWHSSTSAWPWLRSSTKRILQSVGPKNQLQHQKLTWNLEMMVSNRNLIFQGSIFRFHVNLPGRTLSPMNPWVQWKMGPPKWKDINIRGTHFPLAWLWEEEYR